GSGDAALATDARCANARNAGATGREAGPGGGDRAADGRISVAPSRSRAAACGAERQRGTGETGEGKGRRGDGERGAEEGTTIGDRRPAIPRPHDRASRVDGAAVGAALWRGRCEGDLLLGS